MIYLGSDGKSLSDRVFIQRVYFELFDFYFSIKYSARLISVMNFIPQINPDFDFM